MRAELLRSVLAARGLVRLAIRNIARNRARTALVLAAIATGVAGIILSGGFVEDLLLELGEAVIHSQSGHIQIAPAGYFDAGSRSPGKNLISPEQAQRLQFNRIPHVAETMRRISFAPLLSNGRSTYPIIAEGIEPEQERKLGTYMVLTAGRLLSPGDRYGALIGAGLAKSMNLKPDDVFNIVASTVDESMNSLEFRVVGVFESFSKDYDDRIVKVPLSAAQELLDTKAANVLVIVLEETRYTNQVAGVLAQQIRPLGLELRTWEVLNDFYDKAVALYDRQFGILRFIVLLMVVLAVAGAINLAVVERIGEFGTMRALGNRSSDIVRLVMIEGALLGLLGAIGGAVAGCVAGWALSRIGISMPPPPNSNLEYIARISLSSSLVAGAAGIGVLAALMASILPALRVSRLPIVEALRRLI